MNLKSVDMYMVIYCIACLSVCGIMFGNLYDNSAASTNSVVELGNAGVCYKEQIAARIKYSGEIRRSELRAIKATCEQKELLGIK